MFCLWLLVPLTWDLSSMFHGIPDTISVSMADNL